MADDVNLVPFKCGGHKGHIDLCGRREGKYPFKKEATGNTVWLPEAYVMRRLQENGGKPPVEVFSSNQGVVK